MRIKITDENKNKIADALTDLRPRGGQGHPTAGEVLELALRAEGKLEELEVPKNFRKGSRFIFSEAGASANAYKYAIKTTRAVIERGSKDWFLVGLETVEKWPKNRREDDIYLSREQEEKSVAALRRKYRILDAA